MSAIVLLFEHSLALPFFGIGMETDLFQSCGHCWVFQIWWHIECSTLTASTFSIWSSSARIWSRPLALFKVMLPKAHLTSHSMVSGSRYVITPSWWEGPGVGIKEVKSWSHEPEEEEKGGQWRRAGTSICLWIFAFLPTNTTEGKGLAWAEPHGNSTSAPSGSRELEMVWSKKSVCTNKVSQCPGAVLGLYHYLL